MEHRLNEILNKFEQALVENFKGKRSDYNLKNDYVDLKYDFVKLLLEATHKEPTNFSFDLFHDKVKATSPLMQENFKKYETEESFTLTSAFRTNND